MFLDMSLCVHFPTKRVPDISDPTSLSGLTYCCQVAYARSSTLSAIPCSAFTGLFYIVPGSTYMFYMDRHTQNAAKLIELLCINAVL